MDERTVWNFWSLAWRVVYCPHSHYAFHLGMGGCRRSRILVYLKYCWLPGEHRAMSGTDYIPLEYASFFKRVTMMESHDKVYPWHSGKHLYTPVLEIDLHKPSQQWLQHENCQRVADDAVIYVLL